MTAIKAYAYILTHNLIGLLLISSGAAGLWDQWSRVRIPLHVQILVAPTYFNYFTYKAAFNVAVIVLGIAILLRRARGIAAVYCLLSALGLLLHFPFGRWFGPPHLIHITFYAFAGIFFLLPKPRMIVLFPPADPEGGNWRKWLLASLQGEGARPVRDRYQRGLLRYVAIVAGVMGLFALSLVVSAPTILGFASKNVAIVTILVLVLIAAAVLKSFERRRGTTLGDIERRATAFLRARSAEDELQRSGSRRPVLYLRSFSVDALPHHEEEAVRELRKVGPVIAIGRPAEDLPPLGAARFYVDDAHWKGKVADVVRVAQLVVWTTGVTEGLRWELSHLVRMLPPEKLILWAHPHLFGLDRDVAEAEWRRFLATLGAVLPVQLPTELGEKRFLFFNSQWECFQVTASGTAAQRMALRTVLVEKGLVRAPSRPQAALRKAGLTFLYYAMWAVGLVAMALGLAALIARVFFRL